MTDLPSQFPRFYVTVPTICPYLEGRMERKVFTELEGDNPREQHNARELHNTLANIGFRRSQDIAYRPSCEGCTECKSVRIPVAPFSPSRSQRRLIRMNRDIIAEQKPNKATPEQYNLLSKYLLKRHATGGMTNMTYDEYISMVEVSPVRSSLIEYRLNQENNHEGMLIAVTLTDFMSESLSMVYSFFDVGKSMGKRSLGTYIILDHVRRARRLNLAHVYLGYWVKDSPKMAYKKNFRPLEILDEDGWFRTGN